MELVVGGIVFSGSMLLLTLSIVALGDKYLDRRG